ncbi:hypothetical protein CEXT_52061 [Caerostris extrusa]|uniref:Uncharacterized protein n=1 Tax=Caerostris extrusa TaxID=172846 RepID=A0AAV4P9E3_CAEEX|nr:hypothetical protein CEXT_52061 [Caerostris extrusa]
MDPGNTWNAHRSQSVPRTPSIVQNAHWSEHYSEGDNFTQSVSLEKWLGVVKTETDWWILATLPPLNAHWSEHYSEGDNFTQSVSLEKWLGVVKTETDWWILAALPPLVRGEIMETPGCGNGPENTLSARRSGHLPRTPSIVQNAHWSEHYSEGDNFTQSISLEKGWV